MDNGRMQQQGVEQALHRARARILADLSAGDVAEPDIVSLVEDSVAHRRWWAGEWPEGAAFLDGLVAQDVQDALLERYGRWPLCPVCSDAGTVGPSPSGTGPHALDVEPELGIDPRWVCGRTGTAVARVGELRPRAGDGGGA